MQKCTTNSKRSVTVLCVTDLNAMRPQNLVAKHLTWDLFCNYAMV